MSDSEDRIVIDDLGTDSEEPKRLVITLEDLAALPPDPYPGMTGAVWTASGIRIKHPVGFAAALGASQARQNLLFGLAGGLLAWLLAEAVFGFDDGANFFEDFGTLGVYLHVILWAGIISAVLGCVLGAADGITGKVRGKAISGGMIGLAVGIIGGAAGGFCAQFAYTLLSGGRGDNMMQQILVRTLGWAIAGFFIGLAQGAPGGNPKKVVNGLLGGFVGGAIGGMGFDCISMIFEGGAASRCFGLIVLGGAAGLAIGLIEEVGKEAWMRITDGPQAGKQFIIYGRITRIGSGPENEIVLVKDPAIAPEHCRIIATPGRFDFQAVVGAAATVNGHPVTAVPLIKGDSIRLGQTTMVFEERVAAVTKQRLHPVQLDGSYYLMKNLLFMLLLTLCLSAGRMCYADDVPVLSEYALPGVVNILVDDQTGSGFFISPSGYLLTNKHVVGDSTTATVKLYSGETLPAEVVTVGTSDVAILKVDRIGVPSLRLGSSLRIKQGEAVIILGSPRGLPNSLTKGTIGHPSREQFGERYIQIDGFINPGNSGGPVINMKGEVIGIVTSQLKDAQGIGFALPIEAAFTIIREQNIPVDTSLDNKEIALQALSDTLHPMAQPRKVWYWDAGLAALIIVMAVGMYLVRQNRKNVANVARFSALGPDDPDIMIELKAKDENKNIEVELK